ncbi:hypothetical protein O181_109251 [Austropuccinia psidii MF-1]|uniref:Uncharacterized protein n=1 Tax=Austropuccinia psidii MF-1 TaxID=1389203 RepID=A0A9Q3JWD3_9BASI|nr:hypothetical protein [Austropuccinia psidii MF-1]
MHKPIFQTPGISTELNQLPTSAPGSGGEISDMVSSDELGIEVESLEHENNTNPPVLLESLIENLKIFKNKNNVEPCAPTEDSGQDQKIFSGKVEIISKEQFVSNRIKTIPRPGKVGNDGKTPYYVP